MVVSRRRRRRRRRKRKKEEEKEEGEWPSSLTGLSTRTSTFSPWRLWNSITRGSFAQELHSLTLVKAVAHVTIVL